MVSRSPWMRYDGTLRACLPTTGPGSIEQAIIYLAALQLTALDAAVHQGVGKTKQWLAESGGDPAKYNPLRRARYQILATANAAKYGKYLAGWLSRVPSDTRTALSRASAGASMNAPSGPAVQAVTSTTCHAGCPSTIKSSRSLIEVARTITYAQSVRRF